MIDIEKFKQNAIAKAIAHLDSVIIGCREQQIELGKVLAQELKVNEQDILRNLKDCSMDLLAKNGLDY